MRYAILSDIHANLAALSAVLDDLAGQSVTALICLGDAVGYYADSTAVIERLRKLLGAHECIADGKPGAWPLWVAGNHEWGMLQRIEEEQFSPAARAALARTRPDLAASTRALLAGLPQRIEVALGDGLTATLVHAAPADPVGARGASYIENSEDAQEAAYAFRSQLCLVGHTHYPRICRQMALRTGGPAVWETSDIFEELLPGSSYQFADERLILNPGSVGQPRDGDPRAAYALLDTAARVFCVRRIPYDVAAAQARVRSWLGQAKGDLLDGHGGLAARLARGI